MLGTWSISDDELIQSSDAVDPLLTFGDPTWEEYDLTLEFQKITGTLVLFSFHTAGERKRCWFSPVCWNEGRGSELAHLYNGGWERAKGNFFWQRSPPEDGKWYSVRIEVRGERYRCFLNNQLHFEHKDARFTNGLIGLRTKRTRCKFRNIVVTAPSGDVLWTGFPDLDTDRSTCRMSPELQFLFCRQLPCTVSMACFTEGSQRNTVGE